MMCHRPTHRDNTMTDTAKQSRADWGVEDLVTHFGVSERTVRRWLAGKNPPPHYQPGGPGSQLRFDPDEVRSWARGKVA